MATLVSQSFTPEGFTPKADLAAAPVARARSAHPSFAATSLRARLKILRTCRHSVAAHCRELASAAADAGATGTQRSVADVLVAEVLPLAEAIRFLERAAESILCPVKLGRRGRPFWLRGVAAEIKRVPLGVVLIVAPANYPLLLPGVQCVQALAAGNSVLWKPASGGVGAARIFARLLGEAGLPEGVLQILDESQQAAIDAIRAGVAKVFVTGHADTGRAVMRELAETQTPSVMELSGCDAVFVLEGADLERAACALAFGLRLNGSATCMAPRRVFTSSAIAEDLLQRLLPKLEAIDGIPLSPQVRGLLDELLLDALQRGGIVQRDGRLAGSSRVSPVVVFNAPPDAKILRTDIFAPLLTLCIADTESAALAANAKCPYALTAAIFGPQQKAALLAGKLNVGTVLINDLIVSTADPRVSFGGRGASGFGVTRGRDGLLEMTAVKTVMSQRSRSRRAYVATTAKHVPFFASYIEASHAGSVAAWLRGLRKLFVAARKIENDGE